MWNASVTLSVYWERSKVIFSGSYWTFNLILFEYCIRIIYSICFVIRVSCSIIHNHSIDTFFIFSHFVYNLIKNLKHAHPALPESISSQPRAAFKKDIHSFEIPSRNEFTYARARAPSSITKSKRDNTPSDDSVPTGTYTLLLYSVIKPHNSLSRITVPSSSRTYSPV